MLTCTRRFQFCAGHRLVGHKGPCARPHGHNYVALVTAAADETDSLGMVVDFGELKHVIGAFIDSRWDHGFILEKRRDVMLWQALERVGTKLYPADEPPTAEWMAKTLLETANLILEAPHVRVVEVTIWETENCYATVKV